MKHKTIFTTFSLAILFVANSVAQLKQASYSDGNKKLSGIVIQPKNINTKKAGVLILPAWMGIDDNARSSAEKLAELGYYAFIADIYGEGNYPKDMKSASELSGYYKTNFLEYQRRIRLAMDELIKSGADPNNIVVIGYCFGGTGALEVARANFNVKGVVSFHGGLGRDTTRAINPIATKVLVCHGADDFYVPEAQVKSFQNEMRKSKADWEMIYYANAVHSFTDKAAGNDNSKGAAYNEKAAKRSWMAFMNFLQEVLN
jgi:dienelactone hydrolase